MKLLFITITFISTLNVYAKSLEDLTQQIGSVLE